MRAWRCIALASTLARSTQMIFALLATRLRRCAHVRSPHRCGTGASSCLNGARSTAARLELLVSRRFFNITKLLKLTHACSRVAHALRTEESQCDFAHRCPHLRLRRQCGKRGAATSSSVSAAVFVCHIDRAGTRQALDPRVDHSFVIACRRRAVRVLLACPAVLISSSQAM